MCGSDADAPDARDVRRDGDDGDAAHDDEGDGAIVDDDAEDAHDGGDVPDCAFRPPDETRAGASPGVTCRRLSTPDLEYGLLSFAGDGDRVALTGSDPWGSGRHDLWEYRRSTGCLRQLVRAAGPADELGVAQYPSVDGNTVAYTLGWSIDEDAWHCEMSMVDADSGDTTIVDQTTSARPPSGGGSPCSMAFTDLEYPWVVWRDIREANRWRWYVLAKNVETGELRNLSTDPPDPDGELYWAGIQLDLLESLVVWGGVGPGGREKIVAADLSTGVRWIVAQDVGSRFCPAVTPDWIAWIDLRTHPECDYMSACSADIYGHNRTGGDERPLVVAGDSMQGDDLDGAGPWLVYEDQRDAPTPTRDVDREDNIYALYLPTMTELPIVTWPGSDGTPRAYRRTDGTYGLLFTQEIDYWDATYRLWDCDLPEPPAP